MATATKPIRTLSVTCPFCLSDEETIKLDLNDLSECTCTGCDETFSPQDAVDKLVKLAERWMAVRDWIAVAPTL